MKVQQIAPKIASLIVYTIKELRFSDDETIVTITTLNEIAGNNFRVLKLLFFYKHKNDRSTCIVHHIDSSQLPDHDLYVKGIEKLNISVATGNVDRLF